MGNKSNFKKLLTSAHYLENKQYLGFENITTETKGVAFFGILKASLKLPINSSIILFIDKKTEDEDLAHLAVKQMMQKNITVVAIFNNKKEFK